MRTITVGQIAKGGIAESRENVFSFDSKHKMSVPKGWTESHSSEECGKAPDPTPSPAHVPISANPTHSTVLPFHVNGGP